MQRIRKYIVAGCCLLILALTASACGNPTASARPADQTSFGVGTPEPSPAPVLPERVRVPILMYHHIRVLSSKAGNDWREITVTPQEFSDQMAYLRDHNYQAIHLADLVAYFEHGTSLPQNPVIITFDDAWDDGYKIAYPILRKQGLTASFFVPANWITRVDGTLTWDQIAEMSANGIEFGSHSMTHPFLTKQKPGGLTWELETSKALLEKHTGKTVNILAYPYGFYDDRVLEATREAGYVAGVTIDRGIWATKDNLMTLRRIGIPYGISLKTFEIVLSQPGEGEE
jgi:peptidoglycan/xylan/chitin deacetylase (PgdA/CDA1 family)